jgi:chemotaxis protein CheX
MKIEARYVNPFIEAAINVVKQVAGLEVRRGHLSYKNEPEPSYGVTIIVGVYGFLVGQVVYSMKQEVADRLVERMLGEASLEYDKVIFIDTLGELANMITGNATGLLNQNKENALNITTPAIVTGTNLTVNLIKKPTLVLGLITPPGPIEVSISLEEREENDMFKGFSPEVKRLMMNKKGE